MKFLAPSILSPWSNKYLNVQKSTRDLKKKKKDGEIVVFIEWLPFVDIYLNLKLSYEKSIFII